MSKPIIEVHHMSKKYRLGEVGFGTLLEEINNTWHRLRTGKAQVNIADRSDFWALRDVSFDVQQGEILGIIGRNGAGKSTLLKILSRITEPTAGEAILRGRVASLLEVGTGFNPELTGRENIYLNGTILGMKKREIIAKLDEIIAFSEIEEFIDTPVKRYSSGMYVRLAFAVAAHLEPEILIVDEVLAVGDAEFQKKCLGKMQDVGKGGRTVLFVSHNMGAVQTLCNKACYLQMGQLKAHGEVDAMVGQYRSDASQGGDRQPTDPLKLADGLELLLMKFTPNPVGSGKSLRFALECRVKKQVRITEFALLIYSEQGLRTAMLDLRAYGLPTSLSAGKIWRVSGEISSVPLVEGTYHVGIYINSDNFMGNTLDLASFAIDPVHDVHGTTPYLPVHRGLVELDFTAGFQSTTS
jgi:ABC-type polysaccharide/polyol phosphate transport system ATPase subunit